MKIALVDDDKQQRDTLLEFVSNELTSIGDTTHKITTFENGESFLANWHADTFDLIILDIFMGNITGVEAARKIRETDENVRIVFCTSSNEFASESYEVNARYYLQKPITQEDISKMFQRLNLQNVEQLRMVTLPDGHSLIARDILYTNYANHIVTIYLKDETPHRLRTSHTMLEEILLPCGYFFSPMQGVIVNFYEVAKLTEDTLVLNNGEIIHIARRKCKECKEAYTKFLFHKLRKEVDE